MSQTLPFLPGQTLQLKNSPADYVVFTGESVFIGKNIFITVRYPNGIQKKILSTSVLPIDGASQDPLAQISHGCFGNIGDLKRLITFEKLQGTLNDVIYSMEAAQVDFYPYQFKPVLKFIKSPTQRLILADEVGLGKTIESGLIWIEMQARSQAKRLLVICPPTLMDKWEMELRDKFLIDAQQVKFKDFKKKFAEFQKNRSAEEFALISSYPSLRPSKKDCEKLRRSSASTDGSLSPKAKLLEEIQSWDDIDTLPFDLIIFDEAHYMRNSSTSSYLLGKILSSASQGVLCVSATPINNKNDDLRSLLSFIDEDFVRSQKIFERQIESNRPSVLLQMYLSQNSIDFTKVNQCLENMEKNNYIRGSKLFEKIKITIKNLGKNSSFDRAYEAIRLAEKLDIFGDYISRTRRKQVEENRPLRDPCVYTVEYTDIERAFYDDIEKNIRIQCRKNQSVFSCLALIMHQLMAASCLPAYASNLHDKIQDEDCIFEQFGDLTLDEDYDDLNVQNIPVPSILDPSKIPDPKRLEQSDSKFKKLSEIIKNYNKESIIIFASFHATLHYLFRRLKELNLKVSMIYGKTSKEDRWKEIERFTNGDTQILLSSEVGSEGIDLQCAHILINYDMPWNPMRVEQRIGRIDRVGQKSKILHIINFNIEDTIEKRIYEKLHKKLEYISNVFGEMEAILGKEIRQLALDIFSSSLTPAQENERIENTKRAIITQMEQMHILEEESVQLVGLSQYIDKKIQEYHGNGHYIQPAELENYLKDFFGRYFKGTLIQDNSPAPGCLQLRLTEDAKSALNQFMQNNRSRMAQNLRRFPLYLTFDRNTMKGLSVRQKQHVSFITHLSPLIRWITTYYKENGHNLCRTSALRTSTSLLPKGDFVFDIHLWEFKGIRSYKKLCYGIRNVTNGENISFYESEKIFNDLLKNSRDLLQNNFTTTSIHENINYLEVEMSENFSREFEMFQDENETMYNIRKQQIEEYFNAQIKSIEQAIQTLQQKNSIKMIPLQEARRDKAEQTMQTKLNELRQMSTVDVQESTVAMGIFLNG